MRRAVHLEERSAARPGRESSQRSFFAEGKQLFQKYALFKVRLRRYFHQPAQLFEDIDLIVASQVTNPRQIERHKLELGGAQRSAAGSPGGFGSLDAIPAAES